MAVVKDYRCGGSDGDTLLVTVLSDGDGVGRWVSSTLCVI